MSPFPKTIPQCVGCGFCCRVAPCDLVQRIYKIPLTTCPELIYRDDRWWCGLVEQQPEDRRGIYASEVAIGTGCSSSICNQDRSKIPTPAEIAAHNRR
jgi:hypothetical protein